MFEWLNSRGQRKRERDEVTLPRKTGRAVYSHQLHFISQQGPFATLLQQVNVYCRDMAAESADFWRLSGEGGTNPADQLLAHQSGWKSTWLAAVETRICLAENANWPVPTTVQFHHFEGGSLEAIEKEVNDFCGKHEVKKIQVKKNGDKWLVIVTYWVRP
jgi:hypothetical protein